MNKLYNFIILFYTEIIRLAALFNPKAKQWIAGRKNQFDNIQKSIGINEKIIWFHCASLGEFEQGRPVIELVKKKLHGYKILLTFFSPSGYELQKEYKNADYIFYLPADTSYNAKKFIKIVNPKLVVFVKYEFWYNYINELYKNKIPLIVISSIFRPQQYFFRFYGKWFRNQLHKVTFFYVQNKASAQLLNSIGVLHNKVTGDTRFDRVTNILQDNTEIQGIKDFKDNYKLLIAGSSWPPDEDIILEIIKEHSDLKLIIAPHIIYKTHIQDIIEKFNMYHPVLYSHIKDADLSKNNVLIIDNIGLLSKLYRYADIAYVGGGFGAGIHNLSEAAVYGIPVVFGPNHKRFNEAIDLINIGGGFAFSTVKEAVNIFNLLLKDNKKRIIAGDKAAKYIIKNNGASTIIIDKIEGFLKTKNEL